MNIKELESDAGAMYDVLSQLVDLLDDGQLVDRTVRSANGDLVWLIDELARDLVDKHK